MRTQFDELDSLTEIDPAGPPDPNAHTDPDAQQLLHNILAAAEPTDTTHPRMAAAPARRRMRPWLLAGAAAAVAAAALIVPGITADQAYSSWTSTPTALSGPGLEAAAQECQHFWQDTGLLDSADLNGRADLAEQRGNFRYVVMSTPTHSLDCLIRAEGDGPDGVNYWAGSASEYRAVSTPPPDGLRATSVSLVQSDDVALLFFHAQAGAEVERAIAHVPGHGDIDATVQGGYVAAWAPEVDPEELEPGLSVTLFLTDGEAIELSPDELVDGAAAGG